MKRKSREDQCGWRSVSRVVQLRSAWSSPEWVGLATSLCPRAPVAIQSPIGSLWSAFSQASCRRRGHCGTDGSRADYILRTITFETSILGAVGAGNRALSLAETEAAL